MKLINIFNKLYINALKEAEKKKQIYGDDVEVVLVPIVIEKDKNGKIKNVSGFNQQVILEEENRDL